MAGIPDTVPAGVTVDHQRTVGPCTATDDKVIATDTLTARAGEIVSSDSECGLTVMIGATADHRIEQLHLVAVNRRDLEAAGKAVDKDHVARHITQICPGIASIITYQGDVGFNGSHIFSGTLENLDAHL